MPVPLLPVIYVVTWPDVTSDAIKIGVPSILTGVITYLISKRARVHQLDRERRRRQQDSLERSLDEFEAVHTRYERLSHIYRSYCDASRHLQHDDDWTAMEKALTEAGEMTVSLRSIQGRFVMMGFNQCSDAITNYEEASRRFIFSVDF